MSETPTRPPFSADAVDHAMSATIGQDPALRVRVLAEQRGIVETEIGFALDDAFAQHTGFISRDEVTGAESLRLSLPREGRKPGIVSVSMSTDASGNRTATMSFGGKGYWDNHWSYTDAGAGNSPRLIPMHQEEGTGKLVPAKPSVRADGSTGHDPTGDYEVAFWGRLWPDNLRNGIPEHPKRQGLTGRFGSLALGRHKNR